MVAWLVIGLSPTVKWGTWDLGGGMPSIGVFLRDPNLYLCKFQRNPRKTPNGSIEERDQE